MQSVLNFDGAQVRGRVAAFVVALGWARLLSGEARYVMPPGMDAVV